MSTMKWQVIKKGDKYYPNMKNLTNGLEYGAWDGDFDTYEEALTSLMEGKDRFSKKVKSEVVFEIES